MWPLIQRSALVAMLALTPLATTAQSQATAAGASSPSQQLAQAAPSSPARQSGGIRVDAIDQSPAASQAIGLLDSRNGGLGLDAWNGTMGDFALTLLRRIPAHIPSPAQRDLVHRVVLSTARPPQDLPTGGPSLVATRIEALLRLGAAQEAVQLASALPSDAMTRNVAELNTTAWLADGATDRACTESVGYRERFTGPFWERLAILCRWRAGETAGVELSIDALRESGDASRLFLALADHMTGLRRDRRLPTGDIDALLLAIAETAGGRVVGVISPPDAPLLNRMIARMPDAPAATRLRAAIAAVSAGALSVADWEAVIKIQEPDDSPDLTTLAGHAGLIATLSPDLAGSERLDRVVRGLASVPALSGPTTNVYIRRILDLVPTSDGQPTSIIVTQALAVTGRTSQADQWHATVTEATAAQKAALSLITSVSKGGSIDPRQADQWALASIEQNDATSVDLGLAALSGIGEPIGASAWRALASVSGDRDDRPAPPLALLQQMSDAARGRRPAETALLAVIALGADGPAGIAPATLVRTIAALRAVGLTEDARALAKEALGAATRSTVQD